MLEKLAVWYLTYRGQVILPRSFVGLAMGMATANKTLEDELYAVWRVVVPKNGQLIALNYSYMDGSVNRTIKT